MKIDDVVSSRIGALMPDDGPSAAQAVADLYAGIVAETSALTCNIIRHQAELPLLAGDLVVVMERVRHWERWKVMHRDDMGRLRGIIKWEAMSQEQH